MTNRKWLPKDYQDESIPPPREHPNDWIVRLPGDAYGLAPSDEADGDPRILRDGDIVKFDWTESHGKATFTVHDDSSWSIDCDAPNAPEGGYMIVAIDGDCINTMQDGLESFAKAFIDNLCPSDMPESDTIIFYSWSLEPVDFVFKNGSFQPVETTGGVIQ
ncbi:MAG: hypothetical protein WC722_05870 [Rhodospirillales bacterium]|jgi:hypothetical protein